MKVVINLEKKLNILGIIPARGGSKGIPRKNIKLLAGKPLIHYTITEAKKSKYLSYIVVSTEDVEITNLVEKYGVDVVKRPDELSADDTPTSHVVQHVIKFLQEKENQNFNIIVVLQPTSPLRLVSDIDGAIEMFMKKKCDSVVTVSKVQHPPHWMYTIERDVLVPIIKEKNILRRQDAPKIFQLNGAVFVTSKEYLFKNNLIFSGEIRPYIMPIERSVDIDSPLDLKLAELIISYKLTCDFSKLS